MSEKLLGLLFRVVAGMIFVGVGLMVQPFTFDLYPYGFPVLLAGIVGFIVLDHVPVKLAAERDDD